MDQILQWNLPPSMQSLVNNILIWIGFAVIIGLIARIIVPSKYTQGPLVMLLIGLTGSCIGPLLISFYFQIESFNPIGFVGFVSSLVASVLLLILFHFCLLIAPVKKEKDVKSTSDTNPPSK